MAGKLPKLSKFPLGGTYNSVWSNADYDVTRGVDGPIIYTYTSKASYTHRRATYYPETGIVEVDGYYHSMRTNYFKELFELVDSEKYEILLGWLLGYFNELPHHSETADPKDIAQFSKKLLNKMDKHKMRCSLPMAFLTWKIALEAGRLQYDKYLVQEWLRLHSTRGFALDVELSETIHDIWKAYCEEYERTHDVIVEGLDTLDSVVSPVVIAIPTPKTQLKKENTDNAE